MKDASGPAIENAFDVPWSIDQEERIRSLREEGQTSNRVTNPSQRVEDVESVEENQNDPVNDFVHQAIQDDEIDAANVQAVAQEAYQAQRN